MRAILVLLILLLLPSLAIAEIFQWEDDQGVIHYTDDISKVPPKLRPALEEPDTLPLQESERKTEKSTNPIAITKATSGGRLSANAMTPGDTYMAFHLELRINQYSKASRYLSSRLLASLTKKGEGNLASAVSSMDSALMYDVKVRNSTVKGNTASIMVSGRTEKEEYEARVELIVEGGSWKIVNDNWEVDD